MADYEGSPQDKRQDAKGAKALGVTTQQYEGTSVDEHQDAVGQTLLNRAKANDAGPMISEQDMAHNRGRGSAKAFHTTGW